MLKGIATENVDLYCINRVNGTISRARHCMLGELSKFDQCGHDINTAEHGESDCVYSCWMDVTMNRRGIYCGGTKRARCSVISGSPIGSSTNMPIAFCLGCYALRRIVPFLHADMLRRMLIFKYIGKLWSVNSNEEIA